MTSIGTLVANLESQNIRWKAVASNDITMRHNAWTTIKFEACSADNARGIFRLSTRPIGASSDLES